MCGLNGLFAYHPAAPPPHRAELLRTRDAMDARGPDGVGAWWSSDGRCGLAHTRLAIIDLSADAAQPMISAGGRFSLVYNGEIYNHRELRSGLEARGVTFRTNSDTEVLLHLYHVYGSGMASLLRGMFAFAVYDEERRGIFLARDTYGIKPLYTAMDGWTLRFASQVKALLAGHRVSRDPEPAGIVGFHLFGSVPEPFTLYREIRALPAGHIQWIDAAGPHEPEPFQNMARVFAQARPAALGPEARNALVRAACLDSVRAHLVADVDVGLFLSAGVDSGALLGLMADAGHCRVKAITLGFSEFEGTPDDEVPLAAAVAAAYGAEHVIRRIGAAEFNADLPALLDAMDQPSIDGINTWFVAKTARAAGLKVALSGLGGDELLAGYPSFTDIPRWVARLRALSVIPGLGRALRHLTRYFDLAERKPKAAGLVEYGGSYAGAYLLRRALFLPFELRSILDAGLVEDGLRRLSPVAGIAACLIPEPGSPNARISVLESMNYMRNQLLRDADWAGMAHGIEIRTPFADQVLLEAVAPIIPHLAPGAGKRALAGAPSRPLPDAIVTKAKTGFGIPIGAWTARPPASRTKARPAGLVSRDWAQRIYHDPQWAAKSQPHEALP